MQNAHKSPRLQYSPLYRYPSLTALHRKAQTDNVPLSRHSARLIVGASLRSKGVTDETPFPADSHESIFHTNSPLAFHSPKIIQALANEETSYGLSVSRLTLALPHPWAEQEKVRPALNDVFRVGADLSVALADRITEALYRRIASERSSSSTSPSPSGRQGRSSRRKTPAVSAPRAFFEARWPRRAAGRSAARCACGPSGGGLFARTAVPRCIPSPRKTRPEWRQWRPQASRWKNSLRYRTQRNAASGRLPKRS